MSRPSLLTRLPRLALGLFLLLLGLALVLLDAQEVYVRRGTPHYTHLALGVALAWAGGYIMVPALAERIAKAIFGYIGPYLPKIVVGGRRSTDPPVDGVLPRDAEQAIKEAKQPQTGTVATAHTFDPGA